MEEIPEIDESVLQYNGKTMSDYFAEINQSLNELVDINEKELKESEKPSSIINRVFIDAFGIVGLYLMFFVLCDFTRRILAGGELFGIKWLFWGPYYYITDAPIMTRIWESKKFLEDLSEVRNGEGFEWQEDYSCTQIGNTYLTNCNEQTFHNHPIRDKVGDGLDWVIRHTVGKHFGGLLGNASCEDQSTTIADDCAYDRIKAIWAGYNAFCDLYPSLISRRASDLNWPNTVSNNSGDLHGWNNYEWSAYHLYYDCYLAIYDIGSTVFTGHGTPSNLNPDYDSQNYYCYNAYTLWYEQQPGASEYLPFWPPPQWYTDWRVNYYKEQGLYGTTTQPNAEQRKTMILYWQQNFEQHRFDV